MCMSMCMTNVHAMHVHVHVHVHVLDHADADAHDKRQMTHRSAHLDALRMLSLSWLRACLWCMSVYMGMQISLMREIHEADEFWHVHDQPHAHDKRHKVMAVFRDGCRYA